MSRFSASGVGGLWEITFHDGGLNLLSHDALAELASALDGIPDESRVLLFRSGAPGVFAAGADMSEMRRFGPSDAMEFSREGQELFRRIASLPLLTVACIDGACFGGALDLAMAFDRRYCTERSTFSHPGSRIGIVTGFGGTSRWRAWLHRCAAISIFLDNRILTSADARRLRLVDEIVAGRPELGGPIRGAVDRRRIECLRDLCSLDARLSLPTLHLLTSRRYAVYGS